MRNVALLLFVLAGPLVCNGQLSLAAEPPPNVLFIAVDDLRPQIACYGKSFMHTPNLDRLAARGVLFERAYCMVPTCGASRAALMTSVRPARERFVSYLAWAEKEAPDAIALHTQFQRNGYTTISLGKVFHHREDHAAGWSAPAWRSSRPGYQDAESTKQAIALNKKTWPQKSRYNGPAFESADVPEENYADADCAAKAVEYLTEFSANPEQPFFLAVGFLKPHLPFNAPKKYWDLYDRESIDLPDNYWPPKDAPPGAVHNSGELRAYAGIHPKDPVDRETARSLIHGYYACVSFADAQIGKLLDSLEELGLDQNTIVVLWGDHGWQLGEHGMWNKHSCFETSMHAPLMIAAPTDQGVAPGTRVRGLAEFIDIYPTLCDLANLEVPAHVEGASLLPQMRDPSLPGKPYAVGRFTSGDTIRSDALRFSEYATGKGEIVGSMLYDHLVDPHENRNVVEEYSTQATELAKELRKRKGK